jgi:Fe-S-cluster containining protein
MSDEKSKKEKSIFGSLKNTSAVEPKKLTLDSKIKFRCHPGVSCFTACCGGIKIVLTPYDILCLSRRLELEPSEFVQRYTEPTWLEKTDMPGVLLKMREDDDRCPFVTPEGCTVYTDRPSACRYYPVGMADFHEGGSRDAEGNENISAEDKFYFLVREPHCKGFEEDKEWTVREWRADQGVDVRDEMNKGWLRLVMRRKSFGHQASLSEQAKRMFFMASTDLHTFRRFIFESSFLETYELDPQLIEDIKTDDVALMLFSFEYLAATLFGAKQMPIRPDKLKEKVEQLKKRQSEQVLQSVADYEKMKDDRKKKDED